VADDIYGEVTAKVTFVALFDYYRFEYKKSGDDLVILCPFHDDHEPSLKASDTIGGWKCFGCGRKGNVIHFVAEMEDKTLRQAAQYLKSMFLTDHTITGSADFESNGRETKTERRRRRMKGRQTVSKPQQPKPTKRTGYMKGVEDKLFELLEEEDEDALVKWVKEELLASYRRGQEAGKQEAALEQA
jgi:hypothetical protein